MNATLKTLTEELTALDAQRAELAAKMVSIVQPAGEQAESALATVAAAESKLRGLLGRQLLGESVDIDAAKTELAEARQTAADHAQIAEAAQAARELLQAQIDALNKRAAVLRDQIAHERWREIQDAVGEHDQAYRRLCDATTAAYLELVGVARIADAMRPTQGTPHCYASIGPAEFIFPFPLLAAPSEFRRHHQLFDQHAGAEATAREKFTDLLEV